MILYYELKEQGFNSLWKLSIEDNHELLNNLEKVWNFRFKNYLLINKIMKIKPEK